MHCREWSSARNSVGLKEGVRARASLPLEALAASDDLSDRMARFLQHRCVVLHACQYSRCLYSDALLVYLAQSCHSCAPMG